MGFFLELFKPAWQSDNFEKALRAVEKTTNQIKLAQIANSNCWNYLRVIAAEKLIDQVLAQKLITDIAKNAIRISDRITAAERITDQELISKIAKEIDKKMHPDWFYDLLKKVNDLDFVLDIAKNAKNATVRILMIEKLTDQKALIDIAKNDKDSDVCLKAFNKLTEQLIDQNTLFDIVINGSDYDVLIAAFKKLTDQEALFRIAFYGDNFVKGRGQNPLSCVAIEKRAGNTVEYLLRKVKLRCAAIEKLTDKEALIYLMNRYIYIDASDNWGTGTRNIGVKARDRLAELDT